MSAQIVRSEVVETAFNFYSDTEKKESLAVCKIENEDTIDTLGKALNGGLYDPRMGPLDFTGTGCQTCGLRYANCPGHPGYVELDLPVYYPILFSHLFQILRSKCSYCHKLRVSEFRCRCMLVKLQLLEMGDVTAAQNLEDAVQPPSGVLPDEDGVSEGARVGSKNASKGTNKSARGGLDAEEASADADRLLRSYEQRYHAFATARQRKQRHAQQQGAPVVVLSSVSSSFASSSSGSTPAVGAAERKLPGVPADRQLQALQTQAVEAFMRLAMGVKACENCGAHSPPLRKDGYIKLFRRPLPKKLRKKMQEQGRGHPKNGLDVLAQLERAKRVGSGARRSGSTFNLSAVRRSVLSGDGTGGWGSGGGDGACSDEDGSQTDGDSAGLRMDIQGGGGGDETTDREDLDEEADETEGAADSGSEDVDSDVDGAGAGQGQGQEDEYLAPVEVEAQLQLLWRQERSGALLDFIWGRAASVPLGRSQRATLLDGAGTAGGDGADNGGPGGECWRMFLTRVLLVPPNRFRAAGKLDSSSGTSAEHPQNVYLKKVIQTNRMLRQLMAGQTEPLPPGPGPGSRTEHDHTATAAAAPGSSDAAMDLPKVVSNWIKLQNAVNCYMDSSKDADALKEGANGIRQVLEKKEGLFRRHMMGKRVNFCCRSVISPDPYIGTNEIGIPINFAKTLHYPTPVNSFNVKHMRKLVENGPSIYPGANQIETADGRIIKLDKLSANERAGHAKLLLANPGTKVHRHLINGDVLMVNRQPTLHKPGIMAHRARVLRYVREQTLRMHYANCNTYNADFDGDEMNCHFVQSELARAEANYICNTDNQYIGPTDGAPLRGLIQDHVASGVKLTCKDSFLTRAEFQQLLYVGVSGLPGTEVISPVDTMHMPPPAVVKPRPLWTGKQVVSALLKHLCRSPLPPLHLDARTKTPASAFGEEHAEHAVVFRHSELLSGVLDKAAMGASSLGIVHTVYELYGAELAGRLLSAFGRLFTFHLQGAGHSCGIQDLTLAAEADRERRRLLLKVHSEAEACVMKFFSVPADADADDEDGSSSSNARTSRRLRAQREMAKYLAKDGDRRASKAQIDAAMQSSINQAASSVLKACLPSGLERPFLKNHFAMMVTTGAKGSTVNQSQVSCFLGQQALEGQRVPLMVSGKSLPSFRCFDVSARAGGFVQDRFLTGVRPQEYYFHCMAGREGLVDTAVKTARSGYLQRCLVKHLEDLRVHYDLTVRDSGANVVQFLYGEDGLDPVAAALLGGSPAQMRFLARNNQALVYKHSLHENFFSQGLEMSSAQAHHQRVESARRLVDLSQGRHDISHMAKGSVVLARRKRHDALDWSRGNVDTHWHVAVVMKVRRGHGHGGEKDDTRSAPPCFDLQYASDGAVAKKVPALVLFTRKAGAGGLNVDKGSVSGGQAALHLVRPGVPDPAMSVLALDRCVGACSEKIQDALRSYTSSPAARAEGVITEEGSDRSVTAESLELLLWVKYMRSLACPGEAVGCVAAQGVGEPSTQMTLNTFHLAGHGGANVTLGIPRLREIIMTASRNLKTPTMFAPVLTRSSSLSTVAGKAAAAAKARALARKLSRLSLSQLLSHQGGVEVLEFLRCPADAASARWQRIYRVRLCFEKPRTIEAAFGVRFEAVVGAVKEIMAGKLDAFIKLEQRRAGESASGGVGGLRGRPSKKQQQQQRPGLSEITGARNAGPDVPGSRASRSSSLATLDDDDNDEGESGADEAGATGRMTGRRVRDVLSEDVDPEELAGSSGGGGGGTGKSNRGATRRAAADCSDEDESDDDEDARGEGADDMGNLKLSGTGKETLGYADDDDDDDEDDDDGTGTRSAIDTDTDMGETDHYDEDTDLDVASIASGAKVPAGKRTGQIGKAASTSTAASSSRAAPAKAVSQASGSWVDPRHVTSFHRESFAHSEDPDEEGWVELELAFHSKARRLLMAQLVEKAAALTMVRATKDITAAYAVEEDGVQGVQTAGVNFEALWALPEGTVRLNAITSNDIHAILRTYGVEAARQSIVSEIKAVFGVYGISVDARHLSLIADFMTRGGSFTPLNRAGMLQSASPFQQMSFESTCTFLSRAAQEGLRDSLESPSARIVLGSVAKVGTGCFDLLQPLPHA